MKKWLIPLISLALVLTVACGSNGTPTSSGPRLGAIEGTVTDESGAPVPGIRVFIVSGTAPFPEIAPTTDEEGHYRIGSVPPGTFDVAFHGGPTGDRIGLESVTVEGGRTSTLDLQIRERLNVASWAEAVQTIMNGEVQQVTQTHSLEVTLSLKDGTTLHTIEPRLDEVFRVIEMCGELCSDIVLSTE